MENFLKPFLEKGVVYSLGNAPTDTEASSDISIIKFLQKIIFKHDLLVEFKEVLNSICTPGPFIVKNDLVKDIIKHLILLIQSNEEVNKKIEVFCYLFRSFASSCKGDENVPVLQFFIVLSHVLTIHAGPIANNDVTDDCIINADNFQKAFDVGVLTPSADIFLIFKELLLCLSKTAVSLNTSEVQSYYKWLQKFIKNLAKSYPFQNVFMEIYSISGEIDLKLLEGNLDDIFCSILAQKVTDENFCEFYSVFLERTLMLCAKFQRSDKFVAKFLTSIKVTPTCLVNEIILPSNVVTEFSKIVAVASNQQSLSLMEIFIQNAEESFTLISQNDSGLLLLLVTSKLLIGFFKEVKVFAPSIALTTLQAFINKLDIFKGSLKNFGNFLFSNKIFILKNENIVETFLELCFYCEEIHLLINCYKDSVLQPSLVSESTEDCDWQCCLYSEQWKKLVNLVLKSKLESCASVCFQLALQKLRACKLKKTTLDEDSTVKVIIYQLTSDSCKFNLFQQVPPDDLAILMDALTTVEAKLLSENIFKQALQNDNKAEWVTWISNSKVQENSTFVMLLFSEVLKRTGSYLQDLITDKNYSKISWVSNECFDENNLICEEVVDQLPEKINILLKNNKKIRKSIKKNSEKKFSLAKVVEIFKLLPLPFMKDKFVKFGLSFAVGVGTLLADDEEIACLVFEAICNFLASEIDASTCFDLGLCIKCLSELSHESKNVNDLKVKVIESLVRQCPKTKFGLNQLGEMIENVEAFKHTSVLKMLETQVVLYNELGKCWQRAKKRKSDNDQIGAYRLKLAKVISDEAKEFQETNINSENCKLLLKILAIELNKAIKMEEEEEIANLVEQKFPSYFEFAVKSLKKNYDEASVMFLTAVLQSMPHLRKFLPQDSLLKIWKALKNCEKVNWRLFCSHSSDEEFNEILSDLLKMSKKFLNSVSDKHSSNCFEIWISFFEFSSTSKKNSCRLLLQEFFNYIHDCGLLLKDLPIKKKIFLIEFFSFCVTNKIVIVTSHVLDAIIFCMLECLDDSASVEDYHRLFTLEVEVASAILLRQFVWSKSKIHLTFVIFMRMLGSLIKRCDVGQQINKDDVTLLSTCAFCMEKWVSLMVKKEKDFARTSPYFITTLISSIASVTVLSSIKIHLTNCINHFLSISDSHTVAYLMRILKPGYQQVFNSMYNQFKKYHKYSGKI